MTPDTPDTPNNQTPAGTTTTANATTTTETMTGVGTMQTAPAGYLSEDARAGLINRTIGLRTLGQIDEVRQQIAAWLQTHPGDAGIRALDVRLIEETKALEVDSPGSYTYMTTVDTNQREPLPPAGTANDATTRAGNESIASEG